MSKLNLNNICFIIPSTTNGRDEWQSFEDTYLYNICLKTIPKDIKILIGYDKDDRILNSDIKLDNVEWVKFGYEYKGNPCGIWNSLGHIADAQGYEYIMVCGDDIQFPENPEWLWMFINKLKDNKNIGYSAGWSNNDEIPTQFLIHKTHIEIFDNIFPKQIKNWQCDNYLYDLYKKYGNWMKEYHLLNCGGKPRYEPDNCINLKNILVKKHRKILFQYLNKMNINS